MRWWLLLGLLLLPVPGWTAEHELAWAYTTQPQDTALVVERCRNRRQGCTMQALATLGPQARGYVDATASGRQSYCYRVQVRTTQGPAQRSNTACTP